MFRDPTPSVLTAFAAPLCGLCQPCAAGLAKKRGLAGFASLGRARAVAGRVRNRVLMPPSVAVRSGWAGLGRTTYLGGCEYVALRALHLAERGPVADLWDAEHPP